MKSILEKSSCYKYCFDTLRKSELFCNVDKRTLDSILDICKYETRAKGETANSQHQVNDFLYIIISGRICMLRPEPITHFGIIRS